MGELVDKMGFVQWPDQPCFYRRYSDSVDLELHQDDIYATAPESALSDFAKESCKHIILKVSPLLRAGSKYQHLKAGRLQEVDGL